MGRQIALFGGLGGGPAAAATAKVFTELNTAEYPEFSAAGKMAKI